MDWISSSTTSYKEREGPTIMPCISYVYEVVNVDVCPGDSDIKVNPPGDYNYYIGITIIIGCQIECSSNFY